jgi:diguanylate cyclase (GGDEF)-like protein
MQRDDQTWAETENVCTNLVHDANVRGLVLTTRDVSERVSLESRLVHQAQHDALTGLANRTLFQERVGHAIASQRPGASIAVLFIDLDGFKDVNDSLGHSLGDLLLQLAGRRIRTCVRPGDLPARLGGDEFAVLISDPGGPDAAMAVGERIVRAFRDPFVLEGRRIKVPASIGVSVSDGGTMEELLRNADLAMYLAKRQGGSQVAAYRPEMHAAVLNRLELQNDLAQALDRDQLSLSYQPIHALATGRVVGAEALLRWQHPTRGSIPPEVFIPIAEDTGLIVPIGRWALLQACADVRGFAPQPDGPPWVSVNLSGRQISEETLVHDVERALETSGLDPSRLVLELTESVLIEHKDQAFSVVDQLKARRVRLAIDDFGTGYSSLSYLARLPIDILKIDSIFISHLAEDRGALTRAIIALADTMSLTTIAEGIESHPQADALADLGCALGQGFLYSKALPAPEFRAYLTRAREAAEARPHTVAVPA